MTEEIEPRMTRVLVVDDDPADRRYVIKILDKRYTVIEANNGKEAVNLAKSHKPDIILMDIMMPQGDGFTACANIRANKDTQSIPIVMLTGVGHKLNRQWAETIGAKGYIVKPFKPQELLDTISKLL